MELIFLLIMYIVQYIYLGLLGWVVYGLNGGKFSIRIYVNICTTIINPLRCASVKIFGKIAGG